MKRFILGSYAAQWNDLALLFLRVATGLIFFVHGWQMWQAGKGLTAAFLNTLHFPFPSVFAVILIAIELVGGAALILGVYTRLAAQFTGLVAIVALLTVHLSRGFSDSSGGYEYVLLLVAACATLLVMGAGKWSADKKFLKI